MDKHTDPVDSHSPRRGRAVFLLPNLLTTGALFAGFYAVIQAMNGQIEYAAVAIFVAMVLDGLDGRVARMTNTQSAFGAEYDSLSDMVSFGVAPAVTVYAYALNTMGKLGWIAAFVYCAAAALRLARFNTQVGKADKRWFQGLPSPAAAALIASFVWAGTDNGIVGADIRWGVWLITVFAGLSMVSSFRYYSGKDINLRRSVPFFAIVAIALTFALIAIDPPIVMLLVFLAYAVSGYICVLWPKTRSCPADAVSPDADRDAP
jgi:CDP-diacylglycerol---serine O-phosphatidyltransferase